MDHNVQIVAIAKVRVNHKQVRKVSQEKVLAHRLSLEQGEELYPIDVHVLADGTYTIAGNGRHRFFAYMYSGYTEIPAIVHH